MPHMPGKRVRGRVKRKSHLQAFQTILKKYLQPLHSVRNILIVCALKSDHILKYALRDSHWIKKDLRPEISVRGKELASLGTHTRECYTVIMSLELEVNLTLYLYIQ